MNPAHPAYPLTITATAMRDINRSAVLEIIRRESPISRTAIAARLDVSLPTVMRIIDDLIEEGLVRDQGKTEWSGGRRRALVEYNAEGFVVLGVDLGGMRIYGALSDLGGNIIAERSLEKHGTTGEDSYQRLVELIDELLADPALEGRPVRGIGVGARVGTRIYVGTRSGRGGFLPAPACGAQVTLSLTRPPVGARWRVMLLHWCPRATRSFRAPTAPE